MEVWKIVFLFKGMIFSFHVRFQGCIFEKKQHNMQQKHMKRAGIPQKLSQLIVPFLQVPPKNAAGQRKQVLVLTCFHPPTDCQRRFTVNHPYGLPAFKFDLPGP